MPRLTLKDRTVLAVTGPEAAHFLGATVTCDAEGLTPGTALPGALLTPQGKILFDFMLMRSGDETFLMDCRADIAGDLAKRLTMYKLRAKVEISVAGESLVSIGWDDDSSVDDAVTGRDARFRDTDVARIIAPADFGDDARAQWDALRVENGVAESGSDYSLGDAFPHDVNLDQTGGVSFSKGCFVGQEVVSRMQHRGTARRRVLVAGADAALPPTGTEIAADGPVLGTLGTVAGNAALAICRIDRVASAQDAGKTVAADGVALTLAIPPHVSFTLDTKDGGDA